MKWLLQRTPRSAADGRRWLAAAGVAAVLSVLPNQPLPPAVAAGPEATASASPILLPEPAVLSARLAAISTKRIGQVGLVVTSTDGQVLADRGARVAMTPASTMKVLTAMAAIDALGPDRTFATTVVDGPAGRIHLVGGGDPLLTDKTSTSSAKPASLQRLAALTAAALRADDRASVRLRYDTSLFSGPIFSRHWKTRWLNTEPRIAALEVNSGRLSTGRPTTDPALTAARAFAARLRAAGIKVLSIAAGEAPDGGAELARVTSARLDRQVRRTLLYSDNVAAEMLLRHTAIATGRAGSFSGGAASLKAWLVEHGFWADGQRILDGSGLAPGSKLTPETLAAAVRLALAEGRYEPVIAGLPVAGVSGTLVNRFDDPSEVAGRYTVHAKTGTLSGLAGLAGYLTTADGAVLVFAELAGDASSYYRAYDWLDRSAALIATCGCR